MVIELKKDDYEKLIGQLIFIEENKGDIEQLLISNKLFSSRTDIQKYLRYYTKKVESILPDVVIVNNAESFTFHNNFLPFVVIGSCFTLKDKDGINHYCYLTPNLYENISGFFHIYAFSEQA